ncbi:MAG: S8 family serine peptidase [Actinobacteria bacterium]|nr:S8 family serine peptidase [Actinomycetota bacterium]
MVQGTLVYLVGVRRWAFRACALVVCLLTVLVVAAEARAAVPLPDLPGGEAAPPTLLVKVKPGAEPLERRIDVRPFGLRLTQVFPRLDMVVVAPAAERAPDTEGALAALRRHPAVVWAERSREKRFALVPNDPFFSEQWALPAVHLPAAWDWGTGAASVVVALLDTGLAVDIPDFSGRIVAPYSTYYDSAQSWAWEDVQGHGSATAGVAAATGDNAVGIAGAAWGVGVMPVHLSDGDTLRTEDEVEAILWAVEHGADVINLSFGSLSSDPAEQEAVEYALSRGVVVVAAAGNDGPDTGIEYPAAYPGVIAVGAVDPERRRADFSNTGTALDVVAPGTDILTWSATREVIGLRRVGGTSFAAPLVTGVVALMLSQNPALSPGQVEAILRGSADDLGPAGRDDQYGYGLLDAEKAVRLAAAGDSTPPQTTTTTTAVPSPPGVAFVDVPAGHPYATAIEALAASGVVSGYPDGRFGPDDLVTRQQFAKMVLLALGQTPTENDIAPFVDVESTVSGLYPDHFIALAYALGITTGTSTAPPMYSPYAHITRAQVVSMAVRGADAVAPGNLEAPPPGFTPVFGSFSKTHDGAAARAAWNGLLDGLQGMGPDYDMWRVATRGETAAVLARLLTVR